jgi:prepilin-type N-terminal cleavage/methylation domain-containing protein/prepilin-type processing-associated H-X9-DG protein
MNSRFSRALRGFTLIELLVVIVIIAVLAAILLPVFGSVMAQGDSTKCLNNLRQIGMAINSYATDHDDTLPGPLNAQQYPTYQSGDTGSLPMLLSKYLNLVETRADMDKGAANRANVFVCPSYQKKYPNLDAIVYAMNMRPIPAYSQSPWGDNQSGQQPLKRAILSEWTESVQSNPEFHVPSTETFAMRDTDKLDTEYGASLPTNGTMAPEPIHGGAKLTAGHRNALYYDGHVAPMKLNDQTSDWKPVTNQ